MSVRCASFLPSSSQLYPPPTPLPHHGVKNCPDSAQASYYSGGEGGGALKRQNFGANHPLARCFFLREILLKSP